MTAPWKPWSTLPNYAQTPTSGCSNCLDSKQSVQLTKTFSLRMVEFTSNMLQCCSAGRAYCNPVCIVCTCELHRLRDSRASTQDQHQYIVGRPRRLQRTQENKALWGSSFNYFFLLRNNVWCAHSRKENLLKRSLKSPSDQLMQCQLLLWSSRSCTSPLNAPMPIDRIPIETKRRRPWDLLLEESTFQPRSTSTWATTSSP